MVVARVAASSISKAMFHAEACERERRRNLEIRMTNAKLLLPDPQVLLNAVLFLMTKHAQTCCPGIRGAIAQQLLWLARHPADGISSERRALYAKLAEQWSDVAAAAKPNAFAHGTLTAAPGSYLQ